MYLLMRFHLPWVRYFSLLNRYILITENRHICGESVLVFLLVLGVHEVCISRRHLVAEDDPMRLDDANFKEDVV